MTTNQECLENCSWFDDSLNALKEIRKQIKIEKALYRQYKILPKILDKIDKIAEEGLPK